MTKVWKMETSSIVPSAIEEAAQLIRSGELVAFPTETVYGLGGNGLDPEAIQRIFEAKGRPSDNPLILHISSPHQLEAIAREVSPSAKRLIEAFWPGPLTIVFPKKDIVPAEVSGGLMSVAIRMPSHRIAKKLIEASGVPIAAPSANLSGKPSPTSAKDVLEDLDGRISGMIDGGSSSIGLESTVVDCTTEIPTILRPGGITLEMLEEVLGVVEVDRALTDTEIAPKAPGMKYRHYAPEARMTLFENSKELKEILDRFSKNALETGLIVSKETATRSSIEDNPYLHVHIADNIENLAANFYQLLRNFDRQGIREIFCEIVPETGLGVAMMNRMKKAASHRYWKDIEVNRS